MEMMISNKKIEKTAQQCISLIFDLSKGKKIKFLCKNQETINEHIEQCIEIAKAYGIKLKREKNFLMNPATKGYAEFIEIEGIYKL